MNCTSSIINGLGKRPGSYHVKRYLDTVFPAGDNTAFYSYDRGDTEERYLFGFGDTQIIPVDLTSGDLVDIVYEAPTDYLATSDPQKDLRFHTIADTTFIVNKSKTVTTGTPTESDTAWQAIIYCKRANWGKVYEIYSDEVLVSTWTAPSVVLVTETELDKGITLNTTEIITLLLPNVQVWATANGVTLETFGDVICLSKATGSYSITTLDDNNGTDLIAVENTISQYRNLPDTAKDGYKVKVTGVDQTAENDYYVKFETDNDASIGLGVWAESAGFGVDTDFDASTMPHKLVREADGKFYFRVIEWAFRTAGDDDTNPKPSFVDNEISDIISYQGRLVLTTEENQCASVTFDFFNFWAKSVIQSSADDPIDTASSDNQVTNLHNTLVFNSSLISFSDKAQFAHPGDRAFSSDTFSLASKSRYQNNINCDPVASANSVFFANNFGLFSGIREMRFDTSTENIVSETITEQAKKYIKGNAVQIETSTDYNMLAVRTDVADPELYVYQWYDRDNKRVQAAWHTWDLDAPLVYHKIINNKMYLLTLRGTDYCLEYVDLADQDTTGIAFPVRLSMMEELDIKTTDEAHFLTPTIPDYSTISLADLAVIGGVGTELGGTAVEWSVDGTTIKIPLDALELTDIPLTDDLGEYLVDDSGFYLFDDSYEGAKCWIGLTYSVNAEITNPYVRGQDTKPKTKGTLRYQNMVFNLADTGYVEVKVTRNSGQEYTKVYDTKIIDNTLFVLNGPPAIEDATLSVPIRSNSDRCRINIQSDSHLPFYISDVDWTGEYYETGRRTN